MSLASITVLLPALQLLESRALEVQELQAQLSAADLVSQQLREDGRVSAESLRQQMDRQHKQEVDRLQEQLQVRIVCTCWLCSVLVDKITMWADICNKQAVQLYTRAGTLPTVHVLRL